MKYIYILHSITSGKLYVGSSTRPFDRLVEHNSSIRKTFTSKFRPWEMVALYSVDKGEYSAEAIESFIKKQKGGLVRKMIGPEFIGKEKLAQLVRVPHVRD